MNIKDFSASLKAKQKELDTLMRRELPIKVGRMAKDHYQDNFRKGGFVNGGLQHWPQTKRQNSGSKSAAAGYGPLLSRRNHLFSSVKYTHRETTASGRPTTWNTPRCITGEARHIRP